MPLVQKLSDYVWSSYPSYTKSVITFPWLVKDGIYSELNVLHPLQAYKRYVEVGLDEQTRAFYLRNVCSAIWGSETFTENVYANALSHDK